MGKTVVLSNYFSKRRGNDLRSVAKIWEVARATSAATSFFDPIEFGGETFLDGATPANNPIDQMWSEAADIFRVGADNKWILENHIRCLVSTGTGKLLAIAFETSLLKNEIGDALVAIATDTEQKANTFQTHHTSLFQDRRAFRFNVGSGLERVGLEDTEKIEEIVAASRNFLIQEGTYLDMQACVERLRQRESGPGTAGDTPAVYGLLHGKLWMGDHQPNGQFLLTKYVAPTRIIEGFPLNCYGISTSSPNIGCCGKPVFRVNPRASDVQTCY